MSWCFNQRLPAVMTKTEEREMLFIKISNNLKIIQRVLSDVC